MTKMWSKPRGEIYHIFVVKISAAERCLKVPAPIKLTLIGCQPIKLNTAQRTQVETTFCRDSIENVPMHACPQLYIALVRARVRI